MWIKNCRILYLGRIKDKPIHYCIKKRDWILYLENHLILSGAELLLCLAQIIVANANWTKGKRLIHKMAVHLFLKVDGGGTILLILNLFIAVCPYLQIQ